MLAGFRALGDPVRWGIVSVLAGGSECACRLGDRVGGVPAPLLSHHLRVLKDAGLVVGHRRGRWIDYELVAERLDALRAAVPVPLPAAGCCVPAAVGAASAEVGP